MNVSHDIAVPAYSLAAGIAAGFAILYLLHSPMMPYLAAVSALTSVSAMLIRTMLLQKCSITGIAFLFFTAGIFCAANSSIPHTSATSSAGTAVTRLRQAIAEIPLGGTETAALVNALLTGDKSMLDSTVKADFRDSGASHILALSGLHLGIIYAMLLRVMLLAGHSPAAGIARYLAVVAASGYYTYMTGAPPSLMRAFLFILLNETAKLLKRKTDPARTFRTALMLQLAITPEVITSIGFQLSYLAMAGIVFIYPKLKSWYPEDGKRHGPVTALPVKIWDMAALTISCQIMTGPLVWLKFGTFPKHFLLTNLLSMPLTGILMTSAIATVALSAAGLCPMFMVKITDHAASALIFIMEVIASM